VFLDLFIGKDRASAPNIEFTISRYPLPAWLTAAKAIEEDANPLAVFGDIWGHPRFGLGLPSDRLDTVLLNQAATTLVNEGVGLSGVITSGTRFDAFLADLFRHCDAYLVSGVDGKFGVRLVRGPAGDEPTLDESSLTEEPAIEVDTWAETFNQTVVKFTDRAKDLIEDSVTWNDRANFAIIGATKSQTLEMPWVTRQQLAWKIAAAHCKQNALPRLRGSLVARASAAQALAPGSLFYLSFAASGLVSVLCRVESRTIPSPSSPTVSLQFQEDRGYLNTPDYVAPQDDAVEVQQYSPAAPDTVKVIEHPWAFREDGSAYVSVVVVRGDTLSNRYQLWWERATDSYKRLATEARFGLRGTLNAALTPTDPLVGTIDFTLGSPDKTLPEIAEAEALLGHCLLFAGDEVLWAWSFTLVGPNRYTAQLLRARYGSLRVGHGVGDSVVLFFPTDDRPLKVHKMAFEARTQRFKVQPWLFQLSRDLADCLPVSHAIQLRAYRPLAPLNLRVQGDGHCPTYSTGQDIALTWDQSSPRRAVREAERDCPSHADHVIAEVWDAEGGAKKGEWTFHEETGGTIPNAELVAALGSESGFVLKAYNQRGHLRSLACAQLTVTKI
jgi:hypothetical protein